MVYGMVEPAFAPLRKALDKQVSKHPGGAALAVYHRGKLVADLWGGTRDAAGNPWERDTMSVSFSTTKGIASTALHILADRKLLDYEDPIAKHWPEFAQNGKGGILIRHLMCHEAGLYDVRSLIEDARELLDWELMITKLAAAKPAHPPGDRNAYHALTYGFLAGEIVRRVSGLPFTEFVQTEIAIPLKLEGFHVGVPEDELHLVATLHRRPKPVGNTRSKTISGGSKESIARQIIFGGVSRALRLAGLPSDLRKSQAALLPRGIGGFDFSAPEVIQACIPAANGVFTARSLAKLYACLANGGEIDGVRLLSRETVEKLGRVQNRRPDHVLIFPLRWRLGYHQVATLRGPSKYAFGHFGYGGSGAFAHPKHNLSFAMTVNSGQGTPMGDLRILRMSGIVLNCVGKAAAAS